MSKGEAGEVFKVESPPLVSIVVINYNYGRFIQTAVRSVLLQAYKNIECIIIDDCSTDDSSAVIESLIDEFKCIKSFKNLINSGQSVGALRGFKESAGDYIIFLDADDYLLPGCVDAHVAAHLSLRLAVGVTSVDMVQVCNDRVVTTTSQGFSEFIQSKAGLKKRLTREYGSIFGCDDLSIAVAKQVDNIHYVHPKFSYLWPWSPTSGNCFRREALDLIMANSNFAKLRSCTDIYLLRGVASLTGSALIDRPLAAYRIHTNNVFIKNASVHRLRVFDTKYLMEKSSIAMAMLIDHIMSDFPNLVDRLESPYYLIEALSALDRSWPPIAKRRLGLTYLGQKIVVDRKRIIKAIGRPAFNNWLIQSILHEDKKGDQSLIRKTVGFTLGVVAYPLVWAASYLISSAEARLKQKEKIGARI